MHSIFSFELSVVKKFEEFVIFFIPNAIPQTFVKWIFSYLNDFICYFNLNNSKTAGECRNWSENNRKKLTNLSVPSVIFADASWYGSLRGGVEVGGGNDASFKDGGSRWGIKGSSEISEGLSAVYRFEHKISTANASQPGGRLAYAGLSGGFGTLTLGQVWSASFNHVGGITDGSWFYGNSETSYRVGNALSYAMSAGAISMQLDAIMDGDTDTGDAVDQLEFGMTVDLGDVGKVGIAYVDKKDQMHTSTAKVFDAGTLPTLTGQGGLTIGGTDNLTIGGTENLMIVGADGLEIGGTEGLMIAGVGNLTIGGINGLSLSGDVTPTYDEVTVDDLMGGSLSEDDGGMLMWSANDGDLNDIREGSITSVTHMFEMDTVMPVWVRSPGGSAEDGIVGEGNYVRGMDEDGNTVYTHTDCLGESPDSSCNSVARFAAEKPDDRALSLEEVQEVALGGDDPRDTLVEFHDTSSQVTHTVTGESVNVTGVGHNLGIMGQDDLTIEGTDGLMIVGADGLEIEGTEGLMIAGVEDLTVEGANMLTVEGTENLELTGGELPSMPSVTTTTITPGSRATHIAAQFNLGAVTGYLGYSQSEENGSGMKDKTTHYGVSGGLGDTGMSFHLMARNKDNASGMDTNPWLVGLTKGLGGGATVMVEHGNADDGASGKTRFGLKVDF